LNTYVSWLDWSKSTTGLEWSSLVGNTGRISSNTSQNATNLVITPNLTVQLNKYDTVTIFDGPNSEIVTVSTNTSAGAGTIPVSATAYSHADGTPYCTDGAMGSLAQEIIRASQYAETICKQALFLTTYTDEKLAMPTMRGSIDGNHNLHFRPRHWPIQTLSTLSISMSASVTQYDPSQVVIDSDKQICSMPNMLPLVSNAISQYPIRNISSRNQYAQLIITYSAGYATIPADVVQAVILLVSDYLGIRQNPIGAVDIFSGERKISSVLKGDNTGQSLLYKKAKSILDNYTVQSF
jgi:hypothetical protein